MKGAHACASVRNRRPSARLNADFFNKIGLILVILGCIGIAKCNSRTQDARQLAAASRCILKATPAGSGRLARLLPGGDATGWISRTGPR